MFRKSLLAIMIIAALPVIAATDRTIYVTTLNDEDGENANSCSLREAIKAATLNKLYGGCSAGQTDVTDKIQLKEGIYQLNSTLVVGSPVVITGAEASNYAEVQEDPITNLYPIRANLKTTIKGNNKFSLFDSSVSRSTLGLNSVILQNGANEKGGAILAGGSTALNRVNILDSAATNSGGAIYLAGSEAGVTATDTLFQGNTAVTGAVIGMSCIDNINWTPHSVVLDRSSIIGNGNSSTNSIIAYCGTPNATINASTITQNKASRAILQYVQDEANNFTLHPNSTLGLTSNTIVNNSSDTTSSSTLLYDNVGTITLTTNVLAYNTGKSCRYSLGKVAVDKLSPSKIVASYNAIFKPSDNENQGECDLPNDVVKKGVDTSIDLSGKSFSSVLGSLVEWKSDAPSSQPYLLPYYSPRSVLVNAAGANCDIAPDQRSLNRNVTIGTQLSSQNICDIGAIEFSQLSAADLTGASNTSLVVIKQTYEDSVKRFDNLITNKATDSRLIDRFKFLKATTQKELTEFEKPKGEIGAKHYRQVYADIFANSIEQEKINADNTSTFLKFNQDKYDVVTEPLGSGSQQYLLTKDASLLKGDKDQLKCIYNPVLRQVLMYRENTADGNGVTTPAGDFEYCKYTITTKADSGVSPAVSSTGYIQATIVNIAPIAADDNYTVKYGSDQQLSLNILANDNDDGDGGPSVAGYPAKATPFFSDPVTKRFSNIKITQAPTQGKLVFEYEQPCPDNSATRPEQTCYGGKVSYKANSTFSPFSDSFKYRVLDNELLESNEATVNIVNTATTTDDTRSKGGGSFGIFAIFGLAGLAVLRRKIR